MLGDAGHPISPAARAVHGIAESDLVGASMPKDAIRHFVDWVGSPDCVTLLAHNAAFDASFLGRELGREESPLLATPSSIPSASRAA